VRQHPEKRTVEYILSFDLSLLLLVYPFESGMLFIQPALEMYRTSNSISNQHIDLKTFFTAAMTIWAI
jgi:hypothetical protein